MPIVFPRLVVTPPSPKLGGSTYLSRKLVPIGGADDPEIPRVAVATGMAAGGGLELQRLEGLTAGDARRLIAEAEANSAQGPRTWTVAEKSGIFFKKPSLLRAYGDPGVPVQAMSTEGGGIDDLSAELVLDAAFMAQAAELLRGEDLIAAIPKRGWLLVGRCQPGELPVMMRFRQMAEGIAGRGGRHAITAACFFVRGGALRGVSGDGYLSMVTDPQNPWNA
jgi:hypothetical protein